MTSLFAKISQKHLAKKVVFHSCTEITFQNGHLNLSTEDLPLECVEGQTVKYVTCHSKAHQSRRKLHQNAPIWQKIVPLRENHTKENHHIPNLYHSHQGYVKIHTDSHQLDIFSHQQDIVENAIVYSLGWRHSKLVFMHLFWSGTASEPFWACRLLYITS